MAIQPIDLQTMYSQMSNVSQNATRANEALQMASYIQKQNIVQQTLEQSSKVNEASFENVETMNVKSDGSSSGGGNQNENQNQKKKEPHNTPLEDIKESFIGQHINITR